MTRWRLVAVLSLLSLATGCPKLQGDLVALERLSECPAQTAEQLAARQGDLGPLADTFQLECALALLRDTSDAALHKSALGSRVCSHLAERSTEQARREKFAAEGVRFAEAALALGADADGAVHYYLVVNLGMAIREHVTLAMENLSRMEKELKRAVDLSPDLDAGGPSRVLGMLYLKAPPWPKGIGDGDKALELLADVVQKHPDHPLNHLFYAEALWGVEQEESRDKVRAELTEGRKLLDGGNWGYNKEAWKKEFLELSREVGKQVQESGTPTF